VTISMPSSASLVSIGRHVVSYAMGAVTMAAGLHFVSSDQAESITAAIHQIASGLTSIYGGMSTLIAIGSGLWAAYRVSLSAQKATVAAVPGTMIVIDTAKAPHEMVMSALNPAEPNIVTTQEAATKLAGPAAAASSSRLSF